MTTDAVRESEYWFAIHTVPRRECAVFEGLRAMQIGEVFLPVLDSKNPAVSSPTGSAGRRLLFSHYVFLRDGKGVRPALAELEKMPGVRTVLGSSPTDPSPISGCEINVLKNLCSGRLPPEWIPNPAPGAKARIRRGPMAGATGIVLRRSGQFTVLAFSMPILAGAYELVVPTSNLAILATKAEAPPPEQKPRHRAGRRMKRCRKQSDSRENTPPDS